MSHSTAPIPADIKWRIVIKHYDGQSPKELADNFGVAVSSVYNILKVFRQSGNVEREQQPAPKQCKFSNEDRAHLFQLIQASPQLLVAEYSQELITQHGVFMSDSTICGLMRQFELTTQRVYSKDINPDDELVAEYVAAVGRHALHKLVFIDESLFNKGCRERKRGRGVRGQRLRRRTVYINGEKFTMIGAMSWDGVVSNYAFRGSCSGEIMAWWARHLLIPALAEPSVIILDNSSTHYNDDFLDALTDAGHAYLFLPPYSPSLNAIEEMWSALKAAMRAEQARPGVGHIDAYDLIRIAFESITVPKCRAWIHDAGYC